MSIHKYFNSGGPIHFKCEKSAVDCCLCSACRRCQSFHPFIDIEDPTTWEESTCERCGNPRLVHKFSGKFCYLCSKEISAKKYAVKEKKYRTLNKKIKKHDNRNKYHDYKIYYPTQKPGTLPAKV